MFMVESHRKWWFMSFALPWTHRVTYLGSPQKPVCPQLQESCHGFGTFGPRCRTGPVNSNGKQATPLEANTMSQGPSRPLVRTLS